ncbi:hypothetical protein BX666DRAFT_600083 [Dichotomocladium elegans]|nr:hypothetical protein BX666DRAFT_600083 [Dichotomocladium elegans]
MTGMVLLRSFLSASQSTEGLACCLTRRLTRFSWAAFAFSSSSFCSLAFACSWRALTVAVIAGRYTDPARPMDADEGPLGAAATLGALVRDVDVGTSLSSLGRRPFWCCCCLRGPAYARRRG